MKWEMIRRPRRSMLGLDLGSGQRSRLTLTGSAHRKNMLPLEQARLGPPNL